MKVMGMKTLSTNLLSTVCLLLGTGSANAEEKKSPTLEKIRN